MRVRIGRALLAAVQSTVALIVILSLQTIVPAQRPRVAHAQPSAFNGPMRFRLVVPCTGNGPPCAEYVLAEGVIDETTPERFLAFMRGVDTIPRVYFHSPGGDLGAALKLGRIIRRLGLPTVVGGKYESAKWDDRGRVIERIEVPSGECSSACVYAFLGGVDRSVEVDGALGLHQFRGVDGDGGEGRAQVAMTAIAAYLDEMDVDRRLLDIAGLTPSNRLYQLSVEEAQDLNVDNVSPPPFSPWTIDADSNGRLYAMVSQAQSRGGTGTVALGLVRRGQEYICLMRYTRTDGDLATKEANLAFGEAGCPTLSVGDGYDGREIAVQCTGGWRRVTRDSFSIGFTLSSAALVAMSRAGRIRIDPGFPMVHYSLGPNVVISTDGLPKALAALRR